MVKIPEALMSPWGKAHTSLLLSSFQRWTGRPLLQPSTHPVQDLFVAPFVIVSHGTQSDPILNYGNAKALELWEMSWEQLTQTPSRLTAEPVAREERARLLEEVTQNGFIANYQGIRISRTGKRFQIRQAVVWNLVDSTGTYHGQAATFSNIEPLETSS